MGRCDTNKEQTLYTRLSHLLSSHCIIVATPNNNNHNKELDKKIYGNKCIH